MSEAAQSAQSQHTLQLPTERPRRVERLCPRDEHALASLILGDSLPMRRLRAAILRVAPTGLPVLIQGPTGAGKELVAQALHVAGGRRGELVPFNVAAIADSMFEDALFGHARGAFTGAVSDSRGYLGDAHGGTLFLDEITSLSLHTQAKLLRALETRMYRPVGGSQDKHSDFRVVSATNEDLRATANAGRFRHDLAFRLGAVTLHVPALADRREDVPRLACHFARLFGASCGRDISITDNALDLLVQFDWPGNVRQLKHVVEYAAVLTAGPALGCQEVALAFGDDGHRSCARTSSSVGRGHLLGLLSECNWDTSLAAARLGVHRATLYRRMARVGIRRGRSTGEGSLPKRDLGEGICAQDPVRRHRHDSPGV